MCGICGGIIYPKATSVIDLETLKHMSGVLVHRGPDRDGFYLSEDKRTGLGFRRLSIIDLAGGNQPISNENNLIHVVFNGEIYNFQELRSILEKQGHTFSTNSDTEVIIHAYEQYGVDCVQHLRGMFAFAIWDSVKQKLFLARDRLGKKPLYYWSGPDGLYFASELKALLQVPKIPRYVDKQALVDYLRYQYIPEPRSILKDIYKLPPAHVLIFDCKQNSLSLSRYWQPEFQPKLRISMQEAEEMLLETLRQAVRRRLISDVPLGALLSGGIDSSLVVALMAEAESQVKTFTIGFNTANFDERPYARAVADRYSTDHHELVVRPNMLDILPRLVWSLDEPMADPATLPTYYVSQMARQHVTVVLNGDGGDENFGGYYHYRTALAVQRFGNLPNWLKKQMVGRFALIAKWAGITSLSARLLRLMEQDGWSLAALHEVRTTLYNTNQLSLLLLQGDIPLQKSFLAGIYDNAPDLEGLDAMLRADLLALLPGKFLVKMDRMSMGNSLEARSPLLDQDVVEFAAHLPSRYKLVGGQTKSVLRNLAKRFIPRSLASRPKMGFAVPLVDWLYHQHTVEVRKILINPNAQIYEHVNFAAVKALFECPRSECEINSLRLWSLLILEVWFQEILS